MKLLSASLLVLWSCLVHNVQQSCANHWPAPPEKALAPVSENGSFPTPDSMLTTPDPQTRKASSDATGSLPDHQVPRSAEVAALMMEIDAMADTTDSLESDVIANNHTEDATLVSVTDALADRIGSMEKQVSAFNRSAMHKLINDTGAMEGKIASLEKQLNAFKQSATMMKKIPTMAVAIRSMEKAVRQCLFGAERLSPHTAQNVSNTRTFTAVITFSRRFNKPPVVEVAIAAIEADKRCNLRIKTYASDVGTGGFLLHAREWFYTDVYFVIASWMACSQ